MRNKLSEALGIINTTINELEQLDETQHITNELDKAYDLVEEVGMFLDNLVGEL